MTITFTMGRRPRPRGISRVFLTALSGLCLAACGGGGGGGGSAPPQATPQAALVYGIAAQGHAIGGTVTIEDSGGRIVTLPVSSDSGSFSASVNGLTAPFMLRVASADGNTVLYSAATNTGAANITPLTSLAMMRIAAQAQLATPAALFAAPARFAATLSASALQSASASTLSRLQPAFLAGLPGTPAAGTAPTYDPFAGAYAIGDATDRQLDAYPIVFSDDGNGRIVAMQTDGATGVPVQVARSDTVAIDAKALAIVGSTSVVAGSATSLSAQATFTNAAQQPVAATWSVSGSDSARIDADGKLAAASVATATPVTVTARWFDGATDVAAQATVTLLPMLRPTSLTIQGPADGATVAPGVDVPLSAQVTWSDGTVTTPAVAWSWSGDPSALQQLGSDGQLITGKPVADQPINVTASFSASGVPVSATAPFTVKRFVRRIVSATIAGVAPGQTLRAGDSATLSLQAQWNDGTSSTVASPAWSIGTSSTAPVPYIPATISTAGLLTSSPTYMARDATSPTSSPQLISAGYDPGDGSGAVATVAITFASLPDVPTHLAIQGVTSLPEGASTWYSAVVTYADGSTEATDATWSSDTPTLLLPQPNGSGSETFQAGRYTAEPSQPSMGRIEASRSFTYVDANGQSVGTTLNASLDVAVTWVAPTLVQLAMDADFLSPATANTIVVTGYFQRFGQTSSQPMPDAVLTASDPSMDIDGQLVTPATPSTPSQTWIALTATAHDPTTNAPVQVSRLMTVNLPGTVAKRLMAYPYGPYDPEVQFRAVSSDGHVDEYTVERQAPWELGYDSPATRRRLPLFSGVTEFTQSRTSPALWASQAQETQYVAAVEQGQVIVLRHDDVRLAAGPAMPAVLPDVVNARSLALVARIGDVSGTNAAVRLYVLDQNGTVRQYALPYDASRPLIASDIVFERQLTGTYSQISGGANFVQLLSTSGGAFTEGGDESFALGDPTYASHWDDTFAVQIGFGCEPVCSYVPLTGVTLIHAGFDRAFVTTPTYIGNWGALGPPTLQWLTSTAPSLPQLAVSTLAVHAYLAPGGAVHFDTDTFTEGGTGGPNDITQGNIVTSALASWLPPASEIVDGRRPEGASWPGGEGEDQTEPMMPIIRTTADQLYYLDGRQILDPQGHPITLP